MRVSGRRWVHGSGERYGSGEQGSQASLLSLRADVRTDAPAQIHCRPSCRMAAFKAKTERPLLPELLEDELLRVPFE